MKLRTSPGYDEYGFATVYGSSMSATPTQIELESSPAVGIIPLQEGNRVLESIAAQEGFRALLTFSDLHEQIRNRHFTSAGAAHRDLFETERFILDEVLQLICDRAQALTHADGVVIALAEESGIVCRAAAGQLGIGRGVHLIGESEFLQDCLESGSILRSDNCEIDARVELDFAHAVGARSTVLVPLRGRREQLGVLQAFSTSTRAFTEEDERSLDLFSELVLSALKPEDQDRRISWLSDVAGEVLRIKHSPAAAALPSASVAPEIKCAAPPLESVEVAVAPEPAVATSIEISAREEQSPVAETASEPLPAPTASEESTEIQEVWETPGPIPIHDRTLTFVNRLSLFGSSRPGLSVVVGLIAVAALFSAGAWWGMEGHARSAETKDQRTVVGGSEAKNSPQSVTAPAVPAQGILSPASDNLMSSAKFENEQGSLVAVPDDRLAALPKITGIRHWSSSMGSTVVIDMEDQVPYEVHRLMAPERIYFDLHDTVLAPELNGKSMDVGDVSLTRVRIAQPVAGVTRIVLDTRDGSNFSVSMESNPYRLVVELRGNDRALAASTPPSTRNDSANTVSSTATKQAFAELTTKASTPPVPARTGKFRIVLDAGHGGWDLGTVGRQGLLEKDLVLDVTERLGKLLQARLGSEVMFTRTGDSYLALDQRADFANQAQADLFVSVHANNSNSATARGVETYYSNVFSAPGSREIEKHEDGKIAKVTPVSLSTDELHDKIEQSRRLAASVQRSLYSTLAANSPDIRNRGIKDASYVVLTGTTMPAILTEISFVSSPADEENLQSAAYRQKIAEALFKGIAGYQQSSPRAKVAKLQTAAAQR